MKHFKKKYTEEDVERIIRTTIKQYDHFDPVAFRKNIDINRIDESDRDDIAIWLIESAKDMQLDLVTSEKVEQSNPKQAEQSIRFRQRLKDTLELANLYGSSEEAGIIAAKSRIILDNDVDEGQQQENHHRRCVVT